MPAVSTGLRAHAGVDSEKSANALVDAKM